MVDAASPNAERGSKPSTGSPRSPPSRASGRGETLRLSFASMDFLRAWRNPFSRLREKVAAKRPDEGKPQISTRGDGLSSPPPSPASGRGGARRPLSAWMALFQSLRAAFFQSVQTLLLLARRNPFLSLRKNAAAQRPSECADAGPLSAKPARTEGKSTYARL